MKASLVVPVINQRVFFIDDRAEYLAFVKSKCKDFDDTLTDECGMTFHHEGRTFLGVFDGKPATLMHECIHAAFACLDSCGMPTDRANEEGIAYLADWLFSAWCRRMKWRVEKL